MTTTREMYIRSGAIVPARTVRHFDDPTPTRPVACNSKPLSVCIDPTTPIGHVPAWFVRMLDRDKNEP